MISFFEMLEQFVFGLFFLCFVFCLFSFFVAVAAKFREPKFFLKIFLIKWEKNYTFLWIYLHLLTLFRWAFWGCSLMGKGGGQKGPPSLKSVAHILKWWNLAQLYIIYGRSKKYINHMTHPLTFADISIFSPEISKFFCIMYQETQV